MCVKNWAQLHVHTELSPDGLGTTEALVARAAEIGFTSLAMTDHGSLGNAVSFYIACQQQNIKPIFGLEAYFGWKGQRHHITLNSLSRQGFENLVAISNAAHQNWTSGYPLMTAEILAAHDLSGIAMFSGCPASPIFSGTIADASNFVGAMVDLFTPERFFMEVMCVLDGEHTTRPAELAKRFGLKALITNDVHFPLREQRNSHRILTECRKGFTYDSDQLWLKTPDEMRKTAVKRFDGADVDEWMQNAYDFAESVESWSMYSKPKLPRSKKLVTEFETKLQNALTKNLMMYPSADENAKRNARFELELKTLKDIGFIDYFIILDDIIGFAQKNGIVVGARGSAAGSYILYLLGITNIDPIEHNLYFERFLNKSRKEYPDVDVDIESDRRNEVLDYARERWGGIPVATYSHYSHKSVINDIGRVLKIDRALTAEAGEAGEESESFEEWASQHPDALPAYNAMNGQIRHAGKHAGGVVITTQPVPVEHIGGQLVAAWTEGYDKQLSKVGIVKYDILGLTALSQLKQMRAQVKANGFVIPKEIDVPPDDDPVFDVFKKGDVFGIFQWTGSDGIRDLTMRIEPSTFTDLAVINSLYRPGALDAGTADLYPSLKGAPRLIEPRIDTLLNDTRGVIVFQEQVMAIFAAVMGVPFEESDLIRRLIVKPRPEESEWVRQMRETETGFFETGATNGFSRSVLELLWREILTHARYSFNRAHAAAYAAVACEMAWFKYHHPLFFYAVAMDYDVDNVQTYLLEAASKGIKILPPHVNHPTARYTPDVDTNSIRLPLGIIKFFSPNGAQKVADEFAHNGPFLNLADFRKRIGKRDCTSRACRNLWTLGAFDGLDGDASELFPNSEELDDMSREAAQSEALGFILPTKSIADYLARYKDEPSIVVGFIQDWKDKINKRGNRYRVYYCRPRGTFWTDDNFDAIKKGDFVYVEKNNWGKKRVGKKVRFDADGGTK